MVRDQLTENIHAATELRKAGKTVQTSPALAAAMKNAEPEFTDDTRAFVKDAETVRLWIGNRAKSVGRR